MTLWLSQHKLEKIQQQFILTKIGDYIFSYDGIANATWTTVYLPSTLIYMGDKAFMRDSGDTRITIYVPASLKTGIKFNVWNAKVIYEEGCTNLGTEIGYGPLDITIPSTITSYESWMYWTAGLENITFNSNVDGGLALNILKYADYISQITINGESVLNNINSLCSISGKQYSTTMGPNDSTNFTVRVLSSLEGAESNAYLNNSSNGFVKTHDGLYTVYTKPSYQAQ